MRTGKVASLALALALLAGTAAACTSDPDEPAGGGGDGGNDASGSSNGDGRGTANSAADSTQGLTDDTLKLGVIGVDFGALAQAGLTPDLGDQPQDPPVGGRPDQRGRRHRRAPGRATADHDRRASRHFLYSQVLIMAMVAVSLTILTGWAGQLSLGQFAFVGLGGMSTYALVQNRLAFPAAVLLGAVITDVAAVVVGTPALRMRGLFLAVSTLALAVAAPWILSRSVFDDPDHLTPILRRPVVGSVSLAPQRTYYVCLVALALVVWVASRVRASGLGRSLLAVRDNELAASAVGLSPTRVKLTAFALSGAIAGLAGGLLAGLLVEFAPSDFTATDSVTVVRRIVEQACLLATDARVLCLDEPTAGIAQREAEPFGPLLLAIRAELDASMLVIEHDMPLVMSISDRIYCLEAGRVISSGPPDAVRHDPLVVASYLGTDERAIARSGASVSPALEGSPG